MASTKGIKAGRAFVELFADNTKLVRGLRTAEAKVKAFGSSIRNIGMQMATMGAAMLSPLIASGKVFGDFEQNMNMVSTMLDQPMKYMGAFGRGIRDMAKQFGQSTSVLSKGMYDILSASIDPAGALKVLGVAAKSAIAGLTDTSVAVDGLTSVLNAYQLSAKATDRVSDLMFKTVRRGKIVFEQLAGVIGRVAPLARAAAMPLESMLASLATMTRQGLNAEEAATRLINILKQAPTEAKNIIGLVSQYVGKSLSEIQIDFPEIRAATGIAALAGNIKGLTTDIKLMENAVGSTDKAFDKMASGMKYEMSQVWQTVKDVGIAIGDALAPEMEKFNKQIKSAGEYTAKWISQNKILTVNLAKLTAGITALGAALAVIGITVKAVGAVIGAIAAIATSPIWGTIAAVTGVIAGTFAIFKGIEKAIDNWNTNKVEETAGLMDTLAEKSKGAKKAIEDVSTAFNWAEDPGVQQFADAIKRAIGGDFSTKTEREEIRLVKEEFEKLFGTIENEGAAALKKFQDGMNTVNMAVELGIITDEKKWESIKKLIDAYENKVPNSFKKTLEAYQELQQKMDVDPRVAEFKENKNVLYEAWMAGIIGAEEYSRRVNTLRNEISGIGPLNGIMPQPPDIPNVSDKLKQAFSTRGTFSAFAAFGLGVGSGVEERAAKASEETAKNTRRMLKEIQDAQLEFT